MKGRLITLEGGEGAGKSTLIAALADFLATRGHRVLTTREPGGTAVGEAVRALVLDVGHARLCAESELLLMFAARAQLVREVIAPALAAGTWVLSDRFTDASYAYQGAGRGQPLARIAALEEWVTGGLAPDLTLLLDVPVAEGRARAAGRHAADRIESEEDGFFERVRAGYRARAKAEPARFRVIDASGTIAAVREAALAALAGFLAGEDR